MGAPDVVGAVAGVDELLTAVLSLDRPGYGPDQRRYVNLAYPAPPRSPEPGLKLHQSAAGASRLPRQKAAAVLPFTTSPKPPPARSSSV